MRAARLLLAFLAALACIAIANALCSCDNSGAVEGIEPLGINSICNKISSADLVIKGTIVSKATNVIRGLITYEVLINEIYRAPARIAVGAVVQLYTAASPADCGVQITLVPKNPPMAFVAEEGYGFGEAPIYLIDLCSPNGYTFTSLTTARKNSIKSAGSDCNPSTWPNQNPCGYGVANAPNLCRNRPPICVNVARNLNPTPTYDCVNGGESCDDNDRFCGDTDSAGIQLQCLTSAADNTKASYTNFCFTNAAECEGGSNGRSFSGTFCQNQQCGVSCGSGEACCDGGCRQLRTDENNCGWCNNRCVTSTGAGNGRQCCAAECIDPQVDDGNCGNCGVVCQSGENEDCCSGSCADLDNNDNNCGSCGVVCQSGENEDCCGGECVDLDDNESNCGACSIPCTGLTPFCCSGVCLAACVG